MFADTVIGLRLVLPATDLMGIRPSVQPSSRQFQDDCHRTYCNVDIIDDYRWKVTKPVTSLMDTVICAGRMPEFT